MKSQRNSKKLIKNMAPLHDLYLLSLIDEGHVLNKQTFSDLTKIRYEWDLHRLHKNCVCEQKYNVEYGLSCKKERLITIRHYQVRETTTNLLQIICNDVKSNPSLLPPSGESS